MARPQQLKLFRISLYLVRFVPSVPFRALYSSNVGGCRTMTRTGHALLRCALRKLWLGLTCIAWVMGATGICRIRSCISLTGGMFDVRVFLNAPIIENVCFGLISRLI